MDHSTCEHPPYWVLPANPPKPEPKREPRKLSTANIRAAVREVFDTYANIELINMPALTTFALQNLQTKDHEYRTFAAQVDDFVRTSGEYQLVRGKGGGVRQLY
jgi:hypothetical protein